MKQVLVAMAVTNMLLFAGFVVSAQESLNDKDKNFVKEAASGGMMEVMAGQMAEEKGQSAEVRAFGKRMVEDHGSANAELKAFVQKKDMALASDMERKHKSMIDKLQKTQGSDFDKKYMHMMVKDHTKDVADFRRAEETVMDPELKAWVTKTTPILEQHLQQAKEIAQKVGVDVHKAEKDGGKEAEKKK